MTTLDTNKRIQLEYFNRFLSRVFSEGEESEWVLKGGASILARVPSTRSTRDIDLYRQDFILDQALEDLKRLAAVDLGDHFRFEYAGHEPSVATAAQLYTDGHRVTFQVFIGVAKRSAIQVDLVVGGGMTGETQRTLPTTALELPRLTSFPYRLFPIADHIADKACATMSDYDGRPSSREKDLVDLVVFATTQQINGAQLSLAIDTQRRRRQIDSFERFTVPHSWGPGYERLSKQVPHCADFRTVELAIQLCRRLLDPAIDGSARGKAWSPGDLAWH